VGDDLDDPVVVVAARAGGDGTVQGGGVGEVERGRGRIGLSRRGYRRRGLARGGGGDGVSAISTATPGDRAALQQPDTASCDLGYAPAAGCMGARLAVRAALRIALDA